MKRLLFFLLPLLALAACDGGVSGSPDDNAPPSTELSVRAATLVGQIEEADRLSSTISVSWSGTDPDGFVTAYELRYYPDGTTPPAEQGWTRTTRRDTTILLPIPRGTKAANVVFEVRAVDNRGAKDPTPARTVFPIRNSPPSLTISRTDVPPDTTFTVASFGLTATDPEGVSNLARIEIALNDSTRFVELPADAQYVTLVGEFDRANPTADHGERPRVPRAHVPEHEHPHPRAASQRPQRALRPRRRPDRHDQRCGALPGGGDGQPVVRQEAPHARARGERLPASRLAPCINYHLGVVREFTRRAARTCGISQPPYVTGSTGLVALAPAGPGAGAVPARDVRPLRRDLLGEHAGHRLAHAPQPALRRARDAASSSTRGDASSCTCPVTVPQPSADFQDNLDNPALFLLPDLALSAAPDSIRSITLAYRRRRRGRPARCPASQVPASLRPNAFIITTLPYEASDSRTFTLYEAAYEYQTRNRNSGPWPGPNAVVSYRNGADRAAHVALFSVPT